MVKVTSLDTKKDSAELNNEYIHRMCSIKDDLQLTWNQVASIINKELGLTYSESWYRKNYNNGAFNVTETPVVTVSTASDDSWIDTDPNECEGPCETCEDLSECLEDWSKELLDKENKLKDLNHKLDLKRVEVSDLITQNNAYIRRLSREETIKDIAHDYAVTMNKDKKLNCPVINNIDFNSSKEGILLLSDWHYGMVCDNAWNYYDPDVCVERVNKLLNKVVEYVNVNNLNTVHVLDLADLIAGRIHTQIRIESRFDVITQTMNVAEILAEFLSDLSMHVNVKFYSCLDNHSRLEPNKKESMDLESLARLIPWFLKERLNDNFAVSIMENVYGADIITCNVAGHDVIGVHGDNDSPTHALERLSLMTHKHYSMLCTAHLHHFSCDEQHQSIVVSNSSLMGVDRYAEKLRLTSDPSQTFIIATPKNVCETIYRIVLK